jgi:hypothetical protein
VAHAPVKKAAKVEDPFGADFDAAPAKRPIAHAAPAAPRAAARRPAKAAKSDDWVETFAD